MNSKPLHHSDYALFTRLLKQIRLEAGVTQIELAQRLGIEQSLISKAESQVRRLDVAELYNICLALNVPFTEFAARYERILTTNKALQNAPHRRRRRSDAS